MTHKGTVKRLWDILGGHFRRKGTTPCGRPIWGWEVCSIEEVRRVIPLIRPWSVAKAEELDAMFKWLKGRKNQRGVRYSPAQQQAAQELYWELRRLKRGDHE